MASLLGKEILAVQANAMTVHAPRIVAYFMDLAKNCGEYDDNLETFVCHIHPEDRAEVWESMCVVQDALSARALREDVGIVIKMNGASHAEIKWSGV